VLYQNDSYGKDYLLGLRDGLGVDHTGMVVKEVSYEVTEPTIDSQVVTLQGAGADTLIIAATPKPPRKRSARLTTSVGGRFAI
jgi:branched-chain amino acid transport system substrate-binding protein